MAISNFASVSIELSATPLPQQSFDTILISCFHDIGPLNQRVSSYASLAEMLDAGFVVTDTAYLKAAPIFSQQNPPSVVKIGKRSAAVTHTIDLTPTVTTVGFKYSLTVNGTLCEYTVVTSDTVALICDGLVTAINAIAGVTCTDGTTKVVVTTDTAGDMLTITNRSRELTLLDATAATDLATDLAAYDAEDPNWYGLILDFNSDACVAAAAPYIEAREKMFFVETADSGAVTSSNTDVLSDLQTAAYAKTSGWYHPNLGSGLAAAIMARAFALQAGTEKYHGNTLRGVAEPSINSTERGYLVAKRANWYESAGALVLTTNGKQGSNDWIDSVRGVAALKNAMLTRMVLVVSNNGSPKKLPFTPGGLNAVRIGGQDVLDEYVAIGFLNPGTKDSLDDPQPIFSVPAYTSYSSAQRASRIVGSVTFNARGAGGIHTVNVLGGVEQ